MKKHYTIPFFITHQGCPHKCVFCDQNKITNRSADAPSGVVEKIERYLKTIPREGSEIEVGFFGGTFTGISKELQDDFLKPVQKYIQSGQVQGIRLSTRPDFIDLETLEFLKLRSVKTIELGVQSMSDKVLLASKRGHTARDVENASRAIRGNGFRLGHQMMLGLPASEWEDEIFTAKRAKELGAEEVRIYPAVVIENTGLADMWRRGEYRSLEEEEALRRAAWLLRYFKTEGVKVIRCGLHPSESLIPGKGLLAGPFHPSFRQKAERIIL